MRRWLLIRRDDEPSGVIHCRHPIHGLPATTKISTSNTSSKPGHTSKQTRRTLNHTPSYTIRTNRPLRYVVRGFGFRGGCGGEGYHACEIGLFHSGGGFEAVYVDGGGCLRGYLGTDAVSM